MVSEKRLQVKGHLGQGHEIFRVGVKLINARVLKVSSRSAAFYASYSLKTLGGLHQPPPVPARVKVLGHRLTFQVRSWTQKSGKSGRWLLERRKGWLWFFRGADHEYHVSYDHG